MEADPIRIGQALHELRRSRGWTLRMLAEKAGCSASFLSQIEQGKTSPSLVSMKEICRALGMTVAEFLLINSERRGAKFLKGADPSQLVTQWPRASLHHLLPPTDQTGFSILILELPPRGRTPWRASKRSMHELGMVLEGKVRFEIEAEESPLERNDAVFFDLLSRHRWINTGPKRARVLLLNANYTVVDDLT
jgi:transcriptional regulator with XRE-family HTH domain